MSENDNTRIIDEIDAKICMLLSEREKMLSVRDDGEDNRPVPDRRRLAAVRRVSRAFGSTVAAAYTGILRSFGEKTVDEPRIIDITRELLSAPLYPGDPSPEMEPVVRIADGGDCNVSRLTLGTHTGTHIDAPCHFIDGAGDIASIPPEILVGECIVMDMETFSQEGVMPGCERLLLRTKEDFTEEQAQLLAGVGIKLVGVEGTSVGGEAVHKLLLGAGVVIVESLDLSEIKPGEYTLFCAPLRIAGADGAPCRAMLIK